MKYFVYFVSIVIMQYRNIGQFIRLKRIALGMSLNNFAISNDIEPAVLSRVERGMQDVKFGVLVKIAQGFKMLVSEFVIEYEKSNFTQN